MRLTHFELIKKDNIHPNTQPNVQESLNLLRTHQLFSSLNKRSKKPEE